MLVLDELGKFLEFAASHPESSDVFLLQQLAEYAVRSEGHFSVIGVLHQDFREYASMLPGVERAEWEKIRGRFEDIAFEEPPSQLLRFVAQASEQSRKSDKTPLSERACREVAELAGNLWRLHIAPPGLAEAEGRELLQSCAPLHPLTAALLGPVFRRVGQNERSAFSFLASEEPSALKAWVRANGDGKHHLFDVVHLYDHLRGSLGNALLHTSDGKRWAEAFDAESRHNSLSANAVVLLRAIAMLAIAARWYDVRASRDVLKYALFNRLSADAIDNAIDELESASVVVYRKYNESLAIWEGSDVDVEARLSEGRTRLRDTVGAAALLEKHYRIRPILARRHSYETGTLRFFEVRFAEHSQLHHIATQEYDHDGRIVVLLLTRGQTSEPSKSDLKQLDVRSLVLVVPPAERLTSLALEMAAIDWVERNTPELGHDKTARRELYARRSDVDRHVRLLVDGLLSSAGEERTWYHKGRKIRIQDHRQLNEQLSRISDEVFCSAPAIDNEIINRQELSSSAAAARRNLIERMIESRSTPYLGLEGNPPERSIYRSLLSSEGLGVHGEHKGVWGFRQPSASHRKRPRSAYELFQEIDDFFSKSEQSAKSVEDLFGQLRRPPFGLRDGPIPVLVCAALLARESDVALYKNGEFQPSLTCALFEDLIKRPVDFSVRQLRITGVRSEVFGRLATLLGQTDISERDSKQQVVTIARLLIRFMRSLPEYTQKTEGLSTRTRDTRTTLMTAKEPETMLLEDLPNAVGVLPFQPGDRRRRSKDVDLYITRLKEAIIELRDCFPKLVASLWRSLGEAFGTGVETAHVRARLHERASALSEFAVERDMRMFIERVADESGSEQDWLEGVTSLLAERLPTKWRDEDLAHFGIRLQQFVRRFNLLEATVATRPPNSGQSNGLESIRFAVTSTRFGQIDHTFHVDPSKELSVQAIAKQLARILDKQDSAAAMVALCRVLHHRAVGRLDSCEPSKEGAKL
ncbi:MAG TPA: hypothetical protein PKY77_07670 [Phycisphaerae bacterium]|nr:hypothetical protein [Phycisphaerae bacterium]HRY67879.1 hypothetical protein [Phycisphaerae bacterium]HSA25333.1 hypothetical protein [Phycisphaerae bacterium]